MFVLLVYLFGCSLCFVLVAEVCDLFNLPMYYLTTIFAVVVEALFIIATKTLFIILPPQNY